MNEKDTFGGSIFAGFPAKIEWTWNEDQNGYEGVHLREGVVLWFQQTNNPIAGGAARSQAFNEFLANGPACYVPPQFLDEIYSAVSMLASLKRNLT